MRFRRTLILVLVAGAAALAAFGLTTLGAFRGSFGQLELFTLDLRMRSTPRPRPPDESEVRLVLFDSMSVADWPYLVPFPRAALADLIDVAAAYGARAIGLDVYLDRQYADPTVHGDGDQRLHDAMQRAGNVIIVAPTEGTAEARVLLPPHPYFTEVAAGVATADLPTSYETVRNGSVVVRTQAGSLVPGFALALYAQARGLSLDSLLAETARKGRLELPALPARYAALPAEQATLEVPIVFVGPPSRAGEDDGAFRAYSSSVVQFAPSEWFRDKIVIFGSGFHAEERFRTAFDKAVNAAGDQYGWTYGVEVHANALENLLTGTYLKPLGGWQALGLLLVLSLLAALATFARSAIWGGASAAGLLLAVVVLAWLMFSEGYVHVPMVGPTLALVFSYLGSISYVSVVEGKEKRFIRSTLAKYVSPAVADELVADPSRVKLGGEKRLVTVIFTDLAGFTSLSERIEPEMLLSILNNYLDEMSEIVFAEGGTLDKYIGDAVMAFWGAPTSLPDHAQRACRTALRMQRRLKELNEEWQEKGLPKLKMRCGINTGTPVIGNIGGQKRFDYTALGDAVNLAARLEPACKTYGIDTMLAQQTRLAASDSIIVRELDLLAVYGKKEPVPVYQLVGLAGEDLGPRAELFEQYNRGIETYRRRDFELALQYFQAAAEADATDVPTGIYLERCREYIVNPPPADWDAVERRQIK